MTLDVHAGEAMIGLLGDLRRLRRREFEGPRMKPRKRRVIINTDAKNEGDDQFQGLLSPRVDIRPCYIARSRRSWELPSVDTPGSQSSGRAGASSNVLCTVTNSPDSAASAIEARTSST